MKIFLIGHIVIDTIVRNDETRRAMGGTVIYGAFAGIKHGAQSKIISKIGLDFPDEYLIFLSRSGIDISGIRVKEDSPTTRFKLVYKNTERTLFLQAKCSDMGINDIPVKDIEGNIAVIGSVIGEVTLPAIEMISKKSLMTVSDVQGYLRRVVNKKRIELEATKDVFKVISLSDIVHAEVYEARVLYGTSDPIELAKKIVEDGATISLITQGENGAYIATKEKVIYVPAAQPNRVVDTTGAGDVFTTVFSIEYQKTRSIESAAALASAAVSYLIERPGIEGLRNRWELTNRANKVKENIRVVEGEK